MSLEEMGGSNWYKQRVVRKLGNGRKDSVYGRMFGSEIHLFM